MPRLPRAARHPLTLVVTESVEPADFSDSESQRVLAAAALTVARELGRQAAREYFAELIGRTKVS